MKYRSKAKQLSFLKAEKSDHGGSFAGVKDRKRPISVSKSMHLVLRSSKAKGKYSFKKHKKEIDKILKRFAEKYKVKILSHANVGNHIHLHIKLFRRRFYAPFIRALSAAIMMKVTGFSRWNKKPEGFQFWDTRPFSRLVTSFREALNLKDYILVNQLEAQGLERWQARHNVRIRKNPRPG